VKKKTRDKRFLVLLALRYLLACFALLPLLSLLPAIAVVVVVVVASYYLLSAVEVTPSF